MNHIGMDCHISTMEFAVVNEAGRLFKAGKVGTSAKGFLDFVRQIPQPRQIYMEEGTLAAWVLETCTHHGEKLVITDPKKNHWIGASGQKDDRIDALKLAQLARGGYVKEIHHPVGERRRFRELITAYHDTVKSTTRIKNKIKAKFRQNGIQCGGETVYLKAHREEWRAKLPPNPTLYLIIDGLWDQLEQLERTEKNLLAAAKAQAKQYPEIKYFQCIPGIGFIHAATVSAILETPDRFANKRKVWLYAGLGIVKKESGGKVYSKKLTRDYNRLLKYSLKQAVESAIRSKDNPFRRKYLEMTLQQGIMAHRAKLTIARNMLSIMYTMWRNGERYDPERVSKLNQKQELAS